MSDEAIAQSAGRQSELDRLCKVLMIRLLRPCMALGLTLGATLAGLAGSRPAKTLTAHNGHALVKR